MIFYISDTHWGQASSLVDDDRPYTTPEECFTDMKQKWNLKIRQEDDVYLIGDIADRHTPDIGIYLSQLHGRKHLIAGNHDSWILKNPQAMKWFHSIQLLHEIQDEEGNIIVMCHYPLACWHHKDKTNCYHIYGHIHGKAYDECALMQSLGNAYNAGCMIHHYEPVTLSELIANNNSYWQHLRRMHYQSPLSER